MIEGDNMIGYYNLSKQGTSHRDANPPVVCQDANKVIRLENGWVIAAIADGVGSAAHSEIGAKIAVETSTKILKEYCELINAWNEKSLKAMLLMAYCTAQQEIEKYAGSAKSDGSPIEEYDTTLSVVIYDGKRVAFGHSGDGGMLALNQSGTFKQLTKSQREDSSNQVYPLRYGTEYWVFGYYAEEPVCSVLLATDGIYDVFCPPEIANMSNPIDIHAVRGFMDRNVSPIKELNTEAEFEKRIKDLDKKIDTDLPTVIDDKTIVVLINTDILPEVKNEAYYAKQDFKKLENSDTDVHYYDSEEIDYCLDKILSKNAKSNEYTVFNNSEIIAKIFDSADTDTSEDKIRAMIASTEGQKTDFLAWPKEILYDDSGNFVGYTMPYINGKTLSIASLDKNLSWENRLVLSINLAAAVYKVHSLGHVVGDLNDNNAIYDDKTGTLALISCDSYQITDPNTKEEYPCIVGKSEYIAPELQNEFGKTGHYFTKESDYFSLAVIIHKLLSYDVHPFAVHYMGKGSADNYRIENNIANGRCILFPETCEGCKGEIEKPLQFTLDINEIYPPKICDLFRKTFVDGHKDPKSRASAIDWYNVLNDLLENLKKCPKNPSHSYFNGLAECPLCLNEKRKLQHKRPEDAESAKEPENKNPVSSHTKYYTVNKDAYEIDNRKLLSKGGAGAIYKIDTDLVAKIFHSNIRSDKMEKKLKTMISSSVGKRTDFMAWPKEILYDDLGNFVGYTMPYINGKTLSKASPDKYLNWDKRLALTINLSAAVHSTHSLGHVVGDLNTDNAIYDYNGKLTLIGCDSYHITDPKNKEVYPCVIGKPEFIAPELQDIFGPDHFFTKESDYFALAVIIHKLLSYDVHPFAVHYIGNGSSHEFNVEANINHGRCILFPETCEDCKDEIEKPLLFRLDLNEIYPPKICELFRKTFVDGHKDPKARASAKEWYDVLNDLLKKMKQCTKNQDHYYYDGFAECPLCLNEERRAELVKPSKNADNTGDIHENESITDLIKKVLDFIISLPWRFYRFLVKCYRFVVNLFK